MKHWLRRAGLSVGVLSELGVSLGRAAGITVCLAIVALVILALINQTYPVITTNPFGLTWKRIMRSPRLKTSNYGPQPAGQTEGREADPRRPAAELPATKEGPEGAGQI
jgi:hypothetical protein